MTEFYVLHPETLVNEAGSHLEIGRMPTLCKRQTNFLGSHRTIDNYSNYMHRGEGRQQVYTLLWWKLCVTVLYVLESSLHFSFPLH